MGIDGIGKGGPPAPPTPASGSERPERARGGEASRPFEVDPSKTAAAAVAPAAPAGTSPLERLRAGEIDLDGYLDLKVSEATAHLKGLRAHEMEGLRSLLREQLTGDPSMVDLVEQATGQRPISKE
ncbi:MAG: hypothetical protein ACLQVI_03235 [Polyangiaceae bacterium]